MRGLKSRDMEARAVRTIPIMREKYGQPVGLGSGNVVTRALDLSGERFEPRRRGDISVSHSALPRAKNFQGEQVGLLPSLLWLFGSSPTVPIKRKIGYV